MNSNAYRSAWRRAVGASSLTDVLRRRRRGGLAGRLRHPSIRCCFCSSRKLLPVTQRIDGVRHEGGNATKGQARRCYVSDATTSATTGATCSNDGSKSSGADCSDDDVSSDDDDSHQQRKPFLKHSLSDGTLRHKLRTRQPTLGCVTGLHNDTDHVEVLGLLGYDFLWADAEHSTATPATISNQIVAAERRGLPTLVRIGYGYHDIIGHTQKYLVAGAQGIILPQCESSDDVSRIVEAVKFPPLGRRGLAGERWNAWGLVGEEEEKEEEGTPSDRGYRWPMTIA